jgi:hypothetical protein
MAAFYVTFLPFPPKSGRDVRLSREDVGKPNASLPLKIPRMNNPSESKPNQ